MKRRNWMSWQLFLLILWWVVCAWMVVGLPGCAVGEIESDESESVGGQRCLIQEAHYPTTMDDFLHIYAGRAFLIDDNHLGHDIQLPEGREIHPIACGVVRIYRAASGYGTLVVVIEHTLPEPMVVRTGSGALLTTRQFVSIYGHLRSSSLRTGGHTLPWRVGSMVTPQDVIGYVQNASLNGDGAEHLHLGIRAQTAQEAALSDMNWFRGYDTTPSQRRWFVDPAEFMPELLQTFQDQQVDASIPIDAGVPLIMSPPVTTPIDSGVQMVDVVHPPVSRDVPQVDVVPTMSRDASSPPAPMSLMAGIRYEFRVRSEAGWNAMLPFRLRDQWWASQVCRNTGTTEPEHLTDGWVRCDLAMRVSPFDGSFFTPLHPDWGDAGQLGTVANTPERCSATRGAEWRLTDLGSGRSLYQGSVTGLRCVAVGSQDRLLLPE